MATKPKAKPPGNLSPLEYAALSVVGRGLKPWRPLVPVGKEQEVDFVVWIKGTMHVGDDDPTATRREKPDVEELLGRVLEALGPKTRESVIEALVTAHVAASKEGAEPTPIAADAAVMAKRTIGLLTVETTQEKAGNVSGTLTVAKTSR